MPATPWDMLLQTQTAKGVGMAETEELQAQISALRLLVMSLVAQAPTDALIKDARIRFETWMDMGMSSQVSEEYLRLMQDQKDRHLELLDTLQEQSRARMEQALPEPAPSPERRSLTGRA